MVIHVVFLLPLGYSVGTNSKQIFSLVFFFLLSLYLGFCNWSFCILVVLLLHLVRWSRVNEIAMATKLLLFLHIYSIFAFVLFSIYIDFYCFSFPFLLFIWSGLSTLFFIFLSPPPLSSPFRRSSSSPPPHSCYSTFALSPS